jgi:hypothetical protein
MDKGIFSGFGCMPIEEIGRRTVDSGWEDLRRNFLCI